MKDMLRDIDAMSVIVCSRIRNSRESANMRKRVQRKAWGLGRDEAAEPVSISLMDCSGILAPGIPSDWSVLIADINTSQCGFSERELPRGACSSI